MIELITIQRNDSGSQFVQAKELYSFLGYDRSQWKRWYTKNIIQNQYAIEGIDYAGFDIESSGNRSMDFSLTIDFSKKLCMLAKTKRGEEARQYFIAREKQAKQLEQQQLPQDYLSALKALVQSEEQKQLAQAEVKELKPKAESFDTFINSTSLQGFKEVANMLGYGRNKLMSKLRGLKILTSRNMPYQEYLGRGYFEVKESTQNGFNMATTYVTPKGIDYIRKKLI